MPIHEKRAKRILQLTERYERALVVALLGMLMAVLLVATLSLFILVFATVLDKVRNFELVHTQFTLPLLHDAFTGFLMILIGLELIKTVVMYLDRHIVHAEVVLTVALIAVARHVIDMDLNTAEPLNLMGTAVVVLALSLGYFLFKKAGSWEVRPATPAGAGQSVDSDGE